MGVPTFQFGKEKNTFFLELSRYSRSNQPKIILARYPCLTDKDKAVISCELPDLDLRSYDADFGMKRTHALIRKSGEYSGMFRVLVSLGIIIPTETIVVKGSIETAICQIDKNAFVILPEGVQDTI